MFNIWSTRWWIIFRVRSTFLLPEELIRIRTRKSSLRLMTTADFCSLAFKLWSDPFVGKLVFFRVYSGKLSKGDTVYNPRTNKRERISRLIQIQADKREDVRDLLFRRYRGHRWHQKYHYRRHAL